MELLYAITGHDVGMFRFSGRLTWYVKCEKSKQIIRGYAKNCNTSVH